MVQGVFSVQFSGKVALESNSQGAAPPRNQELLVAANADRFFRPPYVGHRGWLGVSLNTGVDWDELEGIVEDAFASVAPKSLLPD